MSEETQDEEAQDSQLGVELYREYWGRGDEGAQVLAEKEHNRRVFGQTYRERVGPQHRRCIVLCLNPGQRNPQRCPTCYGKAGVLPMDQADVEPLPGRGEQFARWFGRCLGELIDGIMWPFRQGREHRIALIRDILQDAMNAGLTAEITQTCPECAAKEVR